jgi:hypothetical protein
MNRQIETIKRIPIITWLFFGLYIAVSCATFRHSAYGFASIEGGSFWWGALSALAVDAGMILSASSLRKTRNVWLVTGLVTSAIASTYTQLLYAMMSATAVGIADGAAWLGDYAAWIVDVRVLVLPALLPALAVVYAFAAKQNDTRKAELHERVNEILAMGLGKAETAERIWLLGDNGYGDFTAPLVAELAQCSVRTAQSAKPEQGRD